MNLKMNALKIALPVLAYALAMPVVHAAEGEWLTVEETEGSKMLVQAGSLRRAGAAIAFVYRIDLAETQTNPKNGKKYRSTDISASVFCTGRQMIRSAVRAYSGPGGTGELVDEYVPLGDAARPFGLARGSSDERLAAFICKQALPAPAPAQQ